jgi:hypothetical protein
VLEPLARADVAALAGELGAGELASVDVDALVERTRGNPLFVTETVRLLDGRPPRVAELRVPPAITATITERVAPPAGAVVRCSAGLRHRRRLRGRHARGRR